MRNELFINTYYINHHKWSSFEIAIYIVDHAGASWSFLVDNISIL